VYRALSCCAFLLPFGVDVSVVVVVDVVALDHHQLAANQKLHLQLSAIFFQRQRQATSSILLLWGRKKKGTGGRLITDTNTG
jgi:hypothetical protein